MEKTNHGMIVGDGARRFAVAEGFEEMNLLTEHSRKIWLAWKASSSFNWRPGIDSPEWKEHMAALLDTPEKQALLPWIESVIAHPPTGTDRKSTRLNSSHTVTPYAVFCLTKKKPLQRRTGIPG